MNEYVTVIFDANGGGTTVSSKRVTVGGTYGELPIPARFGYEFNGWFTDETAGEKKDENSAVVDDTCHTLYARWTKNPRSDARLKAYKKRKSALIRQKIIIAVSSALVLLAIIGLSVVAYMVKRTKLEDVDGTVYKILKKKDKYILCDKDEKKLEMTENGKFYVTNAGSQVRLNEETGKAEIFAYVDTIGDEVLGNVVTSRLLVFPQVERKNMKRLEVHNEYGTYAFYPKEINKKRVFLIEGHENVAYEQEQFSSLVVSCGYVLAMSKIQDPIADENGEYSEYGLVGEKRKDENGKEYMYNPAWYRLTDNKGKEYTVIVGDAIVSKGGYYIRYINPDYPDKPFIYIVSPDIAKTVLQPVEAMVQPVIVYPMSLTTYVNVEKFTLACDKLENPISFSFIPIEDRLGTTKSGEPYVFHGEGLENLAADDIAIDTCLQSFVNMAFIGVTKMAPGPEDMIRYGISDPAAMIMYDFVVYKQDDKDKKVSYVTAKIPHTLIIGKMTDRGTYHIYSSYSDLIVEVDRRYLGFLDNTMKDWIKPEPYSMNIASTDEIELRRGAETIKFELDNSDTFEFTYLPIDGKTYVSTDSHKKETKFHLVKRDGKFVIAAKNEAGAPPATLAEDMFYLVREGKDGGTELYVIKDKDKTKLDLNSGRTGRGTLYLTKLYDKNLDAVLHVFVDEKTGEWGIVERKVASENLRVTAERGGERKDVNIGYFRHFFQTLITSSIEGETNLPKEERERLGALDDGKADLVLKIKSEEGELRLRFFGYTERKVYFTVNGYGNYYMISDRVEKIWNDASKVFSGEDVNPEGKN